MSEERIQEYQREVVAVAVRQHTYGGDLFTTDCAGGTHAWRVSDDGFWRCCKWCDAAEAMICGDCGYLAIDFGE